MDQNNGSPVQSDALVVFGVTGDLDHKMIFGALSSAVPAFRYEPETVIHPRCAQYSTQIALIDLNTHGTLSCQRDDLHER